jgi:hypothetical protein
MTRLGPWVTALLQTVILLTVFVSASPWLIAADASLPAPRHAGDITLRGLPARPIFNGSVVPGGVYSPAELRSAIERDAAVAAHYRDVRLDQMQAVTLTTGRSAYVSYRNGDRILWTRERIWLKAGETVLTDGTTMIRARCGNCISDVKHEGATAVEPAPGELDQFVVPPIADRGVDAVDAAAPAAEAQLIALLQVPFAAQMMELSGSPFEVPPVIVAGGTVGGNDVVNPWGVGATDPVPAVPPAFVPTVDVPTGTTGTTTTTTTTTGTIGSPTTTLGVDTTSVPPSDSSGDASSGATPAPEPAALWLVAAGVIGIASRRLRRGPRTRN